ncbi:hypothetical protein [Vibrio hangzhouensis]|uniref:hypothetical protein n=1 Tax=Vibrio hangzhouensis TaxID=462991 RepID=UPI001C984C18|nr:hypothetical protein [Vibrio hangzhouensis]MBY6196394.1 hypothetical protein [Vibrio hangzhouensis]
MTINKQFVFSPQDLENDSTKQIDELERQRVALVLKAQQQGGVVEDKNSSL